MADISLHFSSRTPLAGTFTAFANVIGTWRTRARERRELSQLDARSLRDLRARFGKEGIRGFPAAYQVVVRSMFGNKLLLRYEYHSHRVLDKE